jgi:hypothetical protein
VARERTDLLVDLLALELLKLIIREDTAWLCAVCGVAGDGHAPALDMAQVMADIGRPGLPAAF